ncbi:MAG: hypothetical protein AAF728_09160 [Cyanobacteria bacterium P01_D01_bin.128]
MFANLIDRLGDRNPQLLRELKGRLRWRNVIIAVGLSVLAQVLMLIVFIAQLPAPFDISHLQVQTRPDFRYEFNYSLLNDNDMPTRLLVEQVYGDANHLPPVSERPMSGDSILSIGDRSVESFGGDWQAVTRAIEGIDGSFDPADISLPYPEDQFMELDIDDVDLPNLDKSVELEIERGGQTLRVSVERTISPNYYNHYCRILQPGDAAYDQFKPQYRSGKCLLQPDGRHYWVEWTRWYTDFFRVVSVVIAVALLSAGSFLLIQNIDREQRRGTLTFVRLSPRSALTVLGGQILGTPIVVYGTIVLCLPLHLMLGVAGHYGIWRIAVFYSFLLLSSIFFFSLSLLYGLLSQGLGGFQAWLFGGLMLGFQLILGIQLATSSDFGQADIHHWLPLFSPLSALHPFWAPQNPGHELSFGGGALSFVTFTLLYVANSLVWTLWVWHGLRRKFINPNAPLVHRSFSYLFTLCFEVFLLGFASNGSDDEFVLFAVAFINLLFFSLLIAALQPTSQAMADWARFRHTQPKRQRTSKWQDWLFSNQSPPLIAIAANLAIALGTAYTWVNLAGFVDSVEIMASYLACASLILVYAAVSQMIFVSAVRRPSLWAAITIVMMVGIPLFTLAVLYSTGNALAAARIQLIAAPWIIGFDTSVGLGLRLFSLLGQWTALVVFTGIGARQLKRLGASQSQAALSGRGNLSRV